MNPVSLRHLERANSVASRRRKLFCLFHPSDRAAFDDTAKSILGLSDCSLYYFEDEEGLANKHTLEEILSDMCAVVLVVSSNFLFTPCAAREQALPLVKSSAIPILPILVEEGLEEAFNSSVENIQCLCPLNETVDETSVPYLEKLKNYLSRILATDIDDAKLRGAFNASVFLSYRKKDRAMAQKLIRMIHENPACRDISIWYDEFLTPGEDFNESLKSEIEGSDLFAMAITPFMLEGDNYVKIVEYPLACSLGKSVLPFMMQETDREKLSHDFPGVLDGISSDNASTVKNAILEALASLGIKPLQSTAAREYLKGVAYLKGICVEKNTEIALSMITEAAEQGLQEAMARLALMYKEGDGVSRDLTLAAAWQKRLIDTLSKTFAEKPTAEGSEAYIEAFLEMAEIKALAGDYDAAHEYYLEIDNFCRTDAIGEEKHLLKRRAEAFELSGKAWMTAGKYETAWLYCFNKALTVRKTLLEKEVCDETQLAVLEAHCFIAVCAEQSDDVVAVKEQIVFIKNALADLDEDTVTVGDELIFRRYLAVCNHLSHFYNYMLPKNAALSWNLWDMAMDRMMKNRVLIKRLISAYPSKAADRMLLRTFINEGDIHADKKVPNHQNAAMDAYREARLLYDDAFAEDGDSLEATLVLAELDLKGARVFRYLKNNDIAEKIYDSTLAYLREMLKRACLPRLQGVLYECCTDAAEMKKELGELEDARTLLKEAEALSGDGLIPTPQRARALDLLAEMCFDEWDVDGALVYLDERHSLIASYAQKMGRVIDYKALLASFKQLISAYNMAGAFSEAKSLKRDLERLLENYPQLERYLG